MKFTGFLFLSLVLLTTVGCGSGFEAKKTDQVLEAPQIERERGISSPSPGVESGQADQDQADASSEGSSGESTNGWTFKTPQELGYERSEFSVCTQVLEGWVDRDGKICVLTSDGCQSDFVFEQRFERDDEGLCDALTAPQ